MEMKKGLNSLKTGISAVRPPRYRNHEIPEGSKDFIIGPIGGTIHPYPLILIFGSEHCADGQICCSDTVVQLN